MNNLIDGFDTMTSPYDALMGNRNYVSFYRDSGYMNVGFWREDTETASDACDNLMEILFSRLPRSGGKILDVACGQGATTRYISTKVPSDQIVAINISPAQLLKAAVNAPGVDFRLMSATEMDFPDASFDVIVCVEAVHHFATRAKFLKDAFRILKPGGHVLMADSVSPYAHMLHPQENVINSAAEYEQLWHSLGYENLIIADEKRNCWEKCFETMHRWASDRYKEKKMSEEEFDVIAGFSTALMPWASHYFLVSAAKPDIVE